MEERRWCLGLFTYSEVCIDEGEDEALDVLDEVPKHGETLWVRTGLHFGIWAKFRSWKSLMLVTDDYLELLAANLVRLRPILIVLPTSKSSDKSS